MKVSSVQTYLGNQQGVDYSKDKRHDFSSVSNNCDNKDHNSPSFGNLGMATLGMSSAIMQWIESKGYLVSFLIQDGLGMTTPRVWTGFHRDKDITGEYNFQEGFEVLGREGLTGPYIIGVAPLVLALTTKFCKSTNTNTRLIKRLGQNFKSMINSSDFNKSIKEDAEKFKKEFYKYNLTKIYKDTIPNDDKANESIKYIIAEFEKYVSNDKKISNDAKNNIINKLNEMNLETSDQLYNVNKLRVGEGNNIDSFNAADVLRAIKDFGDDAIVKNKDCKNIDERAIENIKNNFSAKRLITNITNIIVTLVGLSIIPKLYARSNVSPGENVLEQIKQKGNNTNNKNVSEKDQEAKEINFKGKGINNEGIMSKLGKLITKYIPEKVSDLLEYKGYNFSRTSFLLLSTFGMIFPRAKRAMERAKVDENGKKDRTEINEIFLRDITSAFSVVFAVPTLTKFMVNCYENKTGFILSNRASDGKNAFRRFVDIINPYSNLDVLSVADLNAIYGNIDSKSKLLNFANFVDEKGGDLAKILSKSSNASTVFKDNTFTLESLESLSKKQKNEKIINFFKQLKVKDLKSKDEVISKLMQGSGGIKNNNIAKMARGLNSLPGVISTVVLSPILLGFFIPMLTYHNTRKANAKKIEAAKKKAASAQAV